MLQHRTRHAAGAGARAAHRWEVEVVGAGSSKRRHFTTQAAAGARAVAEALCVSRATERASDGAKRTAAAAATAELAGRELCTAAAARRTRARCAKGTHAARVRGRGRVLAAACSAGGRRGRRAAAAAAASPHSAAAASSAAFVLLEFSIKLTHTCARVRHAEAAVGGRNHERREALPGVVHHRRRWRALTRPSAPVTSRAERRRRDARAPRPQTGTDA